VSARECEQARDLVAEAVIALTEMRGFVTAGTGRERDFMLPRIDHCLDIIGGAIGLARIVRNLQHDVMEGPMDARLTEPPSARPDCWPEKCGRCGAPWAAIGFDYADGFNCRECGGSDADE
jgi:hypothetical protein